MTATRKLTFFSAAALVALAVVLIASAYRRAGEEPLSAAPAVPTAISNGSTLASADSRWVSTDCRVQVELTADHGFWSVVDDAGKRFSGRGRWAANDDPHTVIARPGSDVEALSVSAITKIDGSTSAQTFTAHVTLNGPSATKELGSCAFALVRHGLAPTAGQGDESTAPLTGD
jgi:hypothetical protein